MLRSGTIAGTLTMAIVACLATTAGAYTVKRGPYQPAPRFSVTYQGSGSWHTTYHSEPPNPGGMHDTNDAADRSSQRWGLRFAGSLGSRSAVLDTATGTEHATGVIDHTHIDGLFTADDIAAHCAVTDAIPPGSALQAQLSARLSAHSPGRPGRLTLTAGNPVATALDFLPGGCPGQTDSLDGLLDNYFTPGFSFSPDWGADRWFASRAVSIPRAVLQRARAVVIRLRETRAGTPPTNCAVRFPSYERCATGGSWSGTLTLRRVSRPEPSGG
jgi:hypothetical protein